MRTKEGLKLRTVMGQSVLMAEGSQIEFNKLVKFNESAALLWTEIEGKEFTVEDLSKILFNYYKISRDIAEKDAKRIFDAWKTNSLIVD